MTNKKRKRKIGFLARSKTKTGKKILLKRTRKGRRQISIK